MGRRNTTARGPLPAPAVRADDPNLTRFAGLVPFIRYMSEELELPQQLKEVIDEPAGRRKYQVHLLLFAFLTGAAVGVWRLAHLEWLRGDAVILKFLRLPSWPVRQVFGKALAGLSDRMIGRLRNLLTATGLWSLRGCEEVTVDFDSSVVVSFGEQEGAVFGYCGKGRNRRRHHPLVASVAGPRTVVNTIYRDGTAIDQDETIDFMRDTRRRLKDGLGTVRVLFRADSGFWSRAVGDWLLKETIPFVFAMPLHAGLKLIILNTAFRALEDDADVEVAKISGELLNLDPRLRIAVVRRRVHDPKAPPQGKEIKNDPNWRYQAVISPIEKAPEDLWRLYNGRGDCERVFKIAKHALGMSWLVGQKLTANNAAFLLRMLAYNADVLFQAEMERQAQAAEAAVLRIGLLVRQRRFYNTPGRLLRAQNRWELRVPNNPTLARAFAFYAPDLFVPS